MKQKKYYFENLYAKELRKTHMTIFFLTHMYYKSVKIEYLNSNKESNIGL